MGKRLSSDPKSVSGQSTIAKVRLGGQPKDPRIELRELLPRLLDFTLLNTTRHVAPSTIFCLVLLLCWVISSQFLLLAAEPREQWANESKKGRLHVHSDFKLPDNEQFLSELQSMSEEVRKTLDLPLETKAIHVVIFQSSSEYERYIKNYFPTIPQRRALFIQDRGPGMLFAHWHRDVETDMRHELVHALLNDRDAPLPLWLDEGLAEYFEVTARKRLNQNPHLLEVASQTAKGVVPTLEALESMTELSQLSNGHYRDSWSWVHFLIHRRPQTRQLLIDYVRRHRSHEAQLPLSRTLVQEVPNLREEYLQHFSALAQPK